MRNQTFIKHFKIVTNTHMAEYQCNDFCSDYGSFWLPL